MSEEFNWIDRERGILTERDRRFLLGELENELSQNARTTKYYNIRQRVTNAIYDFYILARFLPNADIQQIFEPAYKWSRKKRHLNEEGRQSSYPHFSEFLESWTYLFELYAHGMYSSRMSESRELMVDVLTEGIERGTRKYQFDYLSTYQNVAADFSMQSGERVFQDEYLEQVASTLPRNPDEIAERIFRLYRQRKIPSDVANRWMEEFVRSPGIDR